MSDKNNPINDKICFVTVINNFEIFNKTIKNNPNSANYNQIIFDNTKDNISISKHYNSYIIDNINDTDNFWVIFCHQDFGFLEDPLNKLSILDKNYIYGPVGAKIKKGLYIRNSKIYTYKKFFIGQLKQGISNNNFKKIGIKKKKCEVVDTLDCCCIIVHSSLIKKYNLKFDENLDFHMYAEDFCMNAKEKNIITKVIQFDCFHLGGGYLDDNYYKCVEYLKRKYNTHSIISTATDY